MTPILILCTKLFLPRFVFHTSHFKDLYFIHLIVLTSTIMEIMLKSHYAIQGATHNSAIS